MPEESKESTSVNPDPSWEETREAAKVVEASTGPKAEETKPETKPEAPAKEPEKDAPDVDYKAELDKYKERYEKSQKALERVQKGKYGKEAEDDGQAEQPDVESLIDRKADEKITELRREMSVGMVEDALSTLTDDKDERELIRFIYEHELNPSGFRKADVERDMKRAFLLANADRFEAEAVKKATAKVRKDDAETKAVLEASKGAGVSVGREPPMPQETESLSDKDRKWLDALEEHQKIYRYTKTEIEKSKT